MVMAPCGVLISTAVNCDVKLYISCSMFSDEGRAVVWVTCVVCLLSWVYSFRVWSAFAFFNILEISLRRPNFQCQWLRCMAVLTRVDESMVLWASDTERQVPCLLVEVCEMIVVSSLCVCWCVVYFSVAVVFGVSIGPGSGNMFMVCPSYTTQFWQGWYDVPDQHTHNSVFLFIAEFLC